MSPQSQSEGHHPDVDHGPSCVCRHHPLPDGLTVLEGRDAYLAENGFSVAGYTAPRSQGSLFGIAISVPNPPAHQRGVRLHDLVHVATGFGTDHVGEAEISAWQLARGLGGAGTYVGAIVLFNVALGSLLSPRRTWAAAHAGRSGVGSLFRGEWPYSQLLTWTIKRLRDHLGLPRAGLARGVRGLHGRAPTDR